MDFFRFYLSFSGYLVPIRYTLRQKKKDTKVTGAVPFFFF